MKVLKMGFIPEEQKYVAKCSYCYTEVEFQRKEARLESSTRNERFLIVTCPLCGKDIYREI